MPWGIASAAIGAVGSIFGGSSQSSSADASAQVQQNIFNQTQQNLQPYMTAGSSALGNLQSLLGIGGSSDWASNAMKQLQQSPGYQFQFNQGLNALDASAASRGMLLSGAQQKDVTQYGQGFAQNAWNSYLAQISNMANMGQNAAANLGGIGAQSGANIGSSMMAAGQGQANMWGGVANAVNQGLGYFAGSYGNSGGSPLSQFAGATVSPYSNSELASYNTFSPSDLNMSMPSLTF